MVPRSQPSGVQYNGNSALAKVDNIREPAVGGRMKLEIGPSADDRIGKSNCPQRVGDSTCVDFMVSSLDTLASVATPATLASIASLARQATHFGADVRTGGRASRTSRARISPAAGRCFAVGMFSRLGRGTP